MTSRVRTEASAAIPSLPTPQGRTSAGRGRPEPSTRVAIVGAGPYGLSLAAHLDAAGTPFRIFGSPMSAWLEHMPRGMHLKSDGFASDLYDPAGQFTLKRYCGERGIAYADYGTPVPLEVFAQYGRAFQRQLVPTATDAPIVRIGRDPSGFTLLAADGEQVTASEVVIATGLGGFEFVPDALRSLPPGLCSHSSAINDVAIFRGRRVLVVGGGASATDLAALLAAQGSAVALASRREIEFHRPPHPGSRWQRMTAPNFGLGPNFRSALYTMFPGAFWWLPPSLRRRIVRRHLGPAGGWFIRDQVVGAVPMHIGYSVVVAQQCAEGVRLQLEGPDGRSLEWQGDHVIAATGYRTCVGHLEILDPQIRASIRSAAGSPILSHRFESSVRGLYFVGVSAAASFGPVMRFALGAAYTSRHLSRHLAARSGLGRRRSARRATAA